jgi:hypothetical protein
MHERFMGIGIYMNVGDFHSDYDWKQRKQNGSISIILTS